MPKSNNSRTKKYLHTIHKYLDCREKMDEKYLEVDELQTIAKFQLTTDSGGIETESDDPHEFKTEYQQQSIKAGPVKTLPELFAAAEISKPIYKDIISRIVQGKLEEATELLLFPLNDGSCCR